jgi:hypothetical protein
MFRLRRRGVASFAIAVLVLAFSIQLAWAQTVGTAPSARALITQSVDEGNLAALRGNTRPEATPQNDRGTVADGFPMVHVLLQLRRSPEQESALQRFLDEIQDSTSPNFHKWLTPEQFGQDFGVAPQDLDAITRWLQSHGFMVNLVYPNRMTIDFSGTAGEVREAFHTEIHNLEVTGERHIANIRDPQIPSALAPAIVGIVSLHDFKPRAQHEMRTAGANYTFNSGGPNYALVPADLATIYNLNPLFSSGISGQGQTIVVIEDTNVFSTSDWSSFRSTFGLSGYSSGSFSTIHPAPLSGTNNCADPGVTPDDIEAILDAEWASAAAPSAAILLASCANTNTTFGGLIALQNLINASSQPPALVSISYGECETLNGAAANATYNTAYQQAVSEGISVFVSAGDSGAAGCDVASMPTNDATDGIGVNAFASTPYNVAVGGTDFSDTYSATNSIYWSSTNTSTFGSALSYIPEIPWNNSCASVLISTFRSGLGTTYGSNGFCNSASGGNYLTTVAGSGGPSACATGSPSLTGVVGGTCRGWPKPSWQSSLSNFGNPNDGVRDTPDVSLFAANGVWLHYYVFCFSDTANGGAACSGAPSSWAGAGGTSFASPIMAGIQALVNQKTGQRQGNPNPVYYQLAANEYNLSSTSCNSANGNGVASTCIFYDVTQGDIDVNCTGNNNCYLPSGSHGVLSTSGNSYSPAYGTTTGWDFATGIGSVNAANLVNNWPGGGVAATSGTPQSAAINTSFPAPLVVTVTNASGNPVNGVTVTFTSPSSGASGSFAGGANTATTNASGVATSATFTANGAPGSYIVKASAVGITGTATFSLTNTASSPASITATSGTPQSTNDDTAFGAPLVAKVIDASGNALTGVTVTFTAPSTGASGSFAGGVNTATTNASGVATSGTFTANGTLGSYTVKASVSGVTATANFSLTNTLGPPAGTTATSGTAQIGAINSAFAAPLEAIVKDAGGNPVSGATVTFTPPASGARGTFGVGGNIATTNASGVATSGTFTANGTTGSYTVTASVPGVTTTASFSLTNMDFSVALDVPGTVQITRGTPATVKLDIATIPANTPLPTAVEFACLVPPGLSGAACSLSSPTISAGSTSGNTILTISTMAASEESPPAAGPSSRLPGLPLLSGAALLALVAMLGTMGIFSAGPGLRLLPRRLPAYLMLALLAITALGLLSCGGTSSSSSVLSSVSATPASNTGTPVGPSIVTVTATSGTVSKATTININVN